MENTETAARPFAALVQQWRDIEKRKRDFALQAKHRGQDIAANIAMQVSNAYGYCADRIEYEWAANGRATEHQETHETGGTKALASATGSAASSKEPERDESDCAPYWLCYAMAEYVCAINETCEREPVTCAQSSLCITEWCVPCAALAWLNEQKRLSAPLPPNDRTMPRASNQEKI